MKTVIIQKSIDCLKSAIINTEKSLTKMNKNLAKLKKKPFDEVEQKVEDMQTEMNTANSILNTFKNDLRNEEALLEKTIYLEHNNAEAVTCIVERSACIRFGAEIDTTVLFDITNDKNFTDFQNKEQILEQEAFSDYESNNTYEEAACIKIGDKYYVECR
jgi:hypothetical protein